MVDYTKPEAWLEARQEATEAVLQAAIGSTPGNNPVERALLAYQQRALLLVETGVNVLVVEKSRRIGMTWGLAAAAVLKAARARSAGGSDWLYISYSQDMTREFISACAMWAKLFQIAASAVSEFVFKDEKEGEETRSIQAFRIAFASGFEIVGLSSAPRSLRGKQGVVMIDEAAFVDAFKELLKAALALLMWGGQVIICSTHNGTDNPFNQLIQDILLGRLDYSHMRIDLDDALADGLFKRICLVNGNPWSDTAEVAWRAKIVADYGEAAEEELFCVPAQGSGTWLTSELIQRQMLDDPACIVRWQWPKDYLKWDHTAQASHVKGCLAELSPLLAAVNRRHQHALGFDFARVSDLSVVDVLAIDDTLVRRTALVLEMRGVPYDEQSTIVRHILEKLPNAKGAAFDATGAGGFVAESMSRRFGLYDTKLEQGGLIAEIRLSVDWYRNHMPKLKAAFEDGTVTLPRDAMLEGDLRLVRLVRGVALIPDVRKGATGLKRHGDFAVARALAWYASLMNAATFDYETLAQQMADRDSFNTPPSERIDGDSWREPLGAEYRGNL